MIPIRSRVARWVLVAALLVGAAIFFSPDADDPPRARAAGAALGALCVLFAAGVLIPWRRWLLLRLACGCVALGYVVYFVTEVVLLVGGQRQHMGLGEPSAIAAGVALLVIALPLARFAVTGQGRRARRAAAAAARGDAPDELQDRIALAALADAGLDLSVETDVTFSMSFPSAAHASSAANVVAREGNAAHVVAPADDGAPYLCRVYRWLAPTWEAIEAARARYESLARELGGRFEGWAVEKGE